MTPNRAAADDVIGLGEILWDCFPDRRLPGGAQANVAYHAQQLGLRAAVATRVGVDPLGDELLRFLQAKGLRIDLVQRDPDHATGTVTVSSSGGQTSYTFLENSAWDFLETSESWLAAARQARALCFGTLAQRSDSSRRTIYSLLDAAGPNCQIVYDVNLRPPFFEREWIHESLRRARIVKLNDDEVRVLAGMFSTRTQGDDEFARWLLQTYAVDLVCVTRGAAGAMAVAADEQCEVSGIPVPVVDTVGAGDAFTAALLWSRLAGRPLEPSLALANRIGALVASRAGAMPDLTAELADITAGAEAVDRRGRC
jgi:fructokinase